MITAVGTLAPAAERFRSAFAAAAERAGEAAGWIDHDLVIGGWPVRLSFAGPALAPALLTAFGHLPQADAEPVRRIVLWDSASTGVAPPPFDWDTRHVGPRGEVAGLNAGPVRASMDHTSGSLTLWDADRGETIVWVASEGCLPWWERVVPLRIALRYALAGPGRDLVHAAAVGIPAGSDGRGGAGALLGGPSGAGKSTTSLACLEAGLAFAGDDHVLLDVTQPSPCAYTLHRTAKLEPDALARLPALASSCWECAAPEGEKAVVLLDRGERAGRVVRGGLPLTHVVVPHITSERATTVRPLTPATALRALAPSTIFQVPRDGGRQLASLGAAVRRLPCVQLRLGRDDRGPEVLADLLGEAAGA